MRKLEDMLLALVILVCIGVAGVSLVRIYQIYSEQNRAEEMFASLQNQIETTAETTAIPDAPEIPAETADPAGEKYRELHLQNPDLAGWIRVEGTDIDYPVMQTPEEPEFYLEHDFYGGEDRHGVPFADAACDLESADNIILYGHNMRDDTMFAQLHKFTDPAFCEEGHPITFDTLTVSGIWRVVCVFKISAYDTGAFPYHMITKFGNGVTAGDYLARAGYYALWQDDSPLPEDAKLLTLSTCEYTLGNGRLVVVAVKEGNG